MYDHRSQSRSGPSQLSPTVMLKSGFRLGIAGAVLGFVFVPGRALPDVITPWTPLFKGVDHATGASNDARLQQVNALRIDLLDPDIRIFTTPTNGAGLLETDGQTASQFLTTYDPQVAVNAHFFLPCCDPSFPIVGTAKELRGLAISEGTTVSPNDDLTIFGSEAWLLLIESDNQARIASASMPGELSGVFNAVTGAPMILSNGSPTGLEGGVHPRTAAGISQDDRYLLMLAIDGRQPGFSDGATLAETANWLLQFGAFHGLNLDGGGSTTMVMSDGAGGATILNSPIHDGVPGTERVNGSYLGVYAAPISAAVPEPSVGWLLLLGALGMAWRLNVPKRCRR